MMRGKLILGFCILFVLMLSLNTFAVSEIVLATPSDDLGSNYYVDTEIVAVDSSKVTLNKEVTYEQRSYCSSYKDELQINGSMEEVCKKYDIKDVKVKEKVATIKFNDCVTGTYYDIIKNDLFKTKKEDILNGGYSVGIRQCLDNQIVFDVDSFSSYTIEQVDNLTNGLIAYFSFDDNFSNIVPGSRGDDFTPTGATLESTSGKIGSSGVQIDSGEYLTGTNGSLLNYTGDLTIGFWFKHNDYTQDALITFFAFDKSNDASNTENYNIYYDGRAAASPTDSIEANLDRQFNENQVVTSTSNAIIDNDWHWLVYQLDYNVNHTIFIDGVRLGYTSVNGGLDGVNSPQSLLLGVNRVGGTAVFDGSIDDLLIYNRSITAAERSLLYNSSTGFNPLTWTPPGTPTNDTNATGGTTIINIEEPFEFGINEVPRGDGIELVKIMLMVAGAFILGGVLISSTFASVLGVFGGFILLISGGYLYAVSGMLGLTLIVGGLIVFIGFMFKNN